MSDAGVPITQGIEKQLSAVASHLHELAQAQTATGVELKEFKERLLDSVKSLDDRVAGLESENSDLKSKVAALESRQAPLAGPTAWIAVVISAAVAAFQFFK